MFREEQKICEFQTLMWVLTLQEGACHPPPPTLVPIIVPVVALLTGASGDQRDFPQPFSQVSAREKLQPGPTSGR